MSTPSLQKHILFRILNMILFYVGWLYIVSTAVTGSPTKGIFAGICIVAFQVIISRYWIRELLMILGVCTIGFLIDSSFAFFGLVTYSSPNALSSLLCPLWIVSLYALFASTLTSSLSWMKYQPILCMVMGSVGGTLSYFYGFKVHAITSTYPENFALSIIAVVWLIALPLFFGWSRYLDRTLTLSS